MSIAGLATLARKSALDPEPSYWARQVVREMETEHFAGQDDYAEWTPAFTRKLAQWLDTQAKGERVNAPAAQPALQAAE